MTRHPGGLWLAARKVAAGLIAFIPAARALATSAPDVIQKLVKGRVIEARPDLLVVETSDRGELILKIPVGHADPTRRPFHGPPIETGDNLVAWVGPRRGGAYAVEQLWVNWTTLKGTVVELHQNHGLNLLVEAGPLAGTSVTVRIDSATTITTTQEAAAAGQRLAPALGQTIQVAGRTLKDGSVLAAQLYLQPN